MGRKGFQSYEHFEREFLIGRAGPLTSAVEDMADDLFRPDFTEEFESLWEGADGDDEA